MVLPKILLEYTATAYLRYARDWRNAHVMLMMTFAAAFCLFRESNLQGDARQQGAEALLLHGVLRYTTLGLPERFCKEVHSAQAGRHAVKLFTPSMNTAKEWVYLMTPFERLLKLYVMVYDSAPRSDEENDVLTFLVDAAERAFGRGLTIVHIARKEARRTLTSTIKPAGTPVRTTQVIGRVDQEGRMQAN